MQLNKTLMAAVLLSGSSVWAQAPVEDINDPNRHRSAGVGIEAEIYQQLQQLQQEIMSLRGTVEEQGHQLRRLKQQSLDRYIDMDRRISSIAGGAPADALAPLPEGEATPDAAAGETPAVATPEQPSATSPVPPSTLTGKPSVDYANAYGLVKARQYREAIAAFEAYIKAHPDSRYTPNAWYWLGELYVAISPQNLSASAAAFQTLLAQYPENGKIPAAMYKLATVYFLQEDRDKAREMLTHVIDRYGNTGNSAVIKAREFLRKNY